MQEQDTITEQGEAEISDKSQTSSSSVDTSSESGVSDAMTDLIREFESFQADPEPIPTEEEIAEMEKQEQSSKSPDPKSELDAQSDTLSEPQTPPSEEASESDSDLSQPEESTKDLSDAPVKDQENANSAENKPEVATIQETVEGRETHTNLTPHPATVVGPTDRISESYRDPAPIRSNKTYIAPEDGFLLGKILWNTLQFITRFFGSLIVPQDWVQRFQNLRSRRSISRILLPAPSGLPESVHIVHLPSGSSLSSVTIDSSRHQKFQDFRANWEKDIEGTARIIWNDDSKQSSEPVLKTDSSGKTSVIHRAGNCGIVCHFEGSTKVDDINKVDFLTHDVENEFPDIFLEKNIHPETSSSIEAMDEKMKRWIQVNRLQAKSPSLIKWSFTSAIFSALIVIQLLNGYQTKHNQNLFNRFVDALEKEPGIVVVHARGNQIQLLQDELAADPESIAYKSGIEKSVSLDVTPFQSMEPEIVIKRAYSALAPPKEVTLAMDGRRLVIVGLASQEWIRHAHQVAPIIPGVTGIQVSALKSTIPDVPEESTNLSSAELLDAKIHQLNQKPIYFEKNKSLLSDGEHKKLDQLIIQMIETIQLAKSIGYTYQIEINGFITKEEYVNFGSALGKQRAEAISSFLQLRNVPQESIQTVSRGNSSPTVKTSSSQCSFVSLKLFKDSAIEPIAHPGH